MCKPENNTSILKPLDKREQQPQLVHYLMCSAQRAAEEISKAILNQRLSTASLPAVAVSAGRQLNTQSLQDALSATYQEALYDADSASYRSNQRRKRISPSEDGNCDKNDNDKTLNSEDLTPDNEGSHSIATRTKKRRRHSQVSKNGEEKLQRRNIVQHDYHDYSTYVMTETEHDSKKGPGSSPPFPVLLHDVLEKAEDEGYNDVISWQSHGRAFHVHDQERFVTEVMPRFFRQTRFSSFQRQLSLYGFLRLVQKGPDHGAYYHELFLRGKPLLLVKMQRTRVKGYWVRQASSPETEPNFHTMVPVGQPAASSVPQHCILPVEPMPMVPMGMPPGILLAKPLVPQTEWLNAQLTNQYFQTLPEGAINPIQTTSLNETYTTQRQSLGPFELPQPMPPMRFQTPQATLKPCDAQSSYASFRQMRASGTTETGTWEEPTEQQSLASFLMDVDLDTSNSDEDDEEQLESIFNSEGTPRYHADV